MSDPVSALGGAFFEGYVTVQEAGLCGLITLRGDLAGAQLRTAVNKLTGVDVPGPCRIALNGEKGVAWMSPDELLILLPYETASAGVSALDKALNGSHFLAENISDSRTVFQVQGAGAVDVLGKLCPADLSPGAFAAGTIRRTRMAQAAVAIWMQNDGSITLVCMRSVSEYVYGLLTNAAKAGSEVGIF